MGKLTYTTAQVQYLLDEVAKINSAVPIENGEVVCIDFKNGTKLQYNFDLDTLEIVYANGTTLQIGREQTTFVYNNTGSTISNGTPVYYSGVGGDVVTVPLIAPADAANLATAMVKGHSTIDIPDGSYGIIVCKGEMTVPSHGLATGNKIYLNTGGGYTTTPPSTPNLTIELGIVLDEDTLHVYPCILSAFSSSSTSVNSQLFFSDTASGISTYKKLAKSLDSAEVTKTLTANSSTSPFEGEKYISDELGITSIPAAVFLAHSTCKVDSSVGITQLRLDLSLYHVGGTTTLIASDISSDINFTTETPVEFSVPFSTVSCVETDRLLVEIYLLVDTATNKTFTYYVGNGRATYVTLPLPISHADLSNLNIDPDFQHVTDSQITAWNSKVDGPASSTDNALVRFDGTTGKLIQNSNATLNDAGDLDISGNLLINNQIYLHVDANQNNFIGYGVGNSTLSGGSNFGFGYNSLSGLTSGNSNVAIGPYSLYGKTSGSDNIAIGVAAGYMNVNGGDNTTGNASIFIGTDTRPLDGNDTNVIAIGHNTAGRGSNTTTIGNSSTATTKLFGQLIIGTIPAKTTETDVIYVGADGSLSKGAAGGSGDVAGPASSIDNAIPRFDGTTGKLLQGGGSITNLDTGEVGIGTITPTEKLDVVGNIAVSGTVDGRDVSVDGSKLDGIEEGAQVNVNADWNSVSGDSQILNKPTDVTNLSLHASSELSDGSDLVKGPASSTDNAIVRFDGTTGKLVQNSTCTIDDTGNVLIVGNSSSTIGIGTVGTYAGTLELTQDSVTMRAKGTYEGYVKVGQVGIQVLMQIEYQPGTSKNFYGRQVPDVDWITTNMLQKSNNLSDVANQQTALNNLTAVSAATNEYVLTKDTDTGNAIWKAVSGGGGGMTNPMTTLGDIIYGAASGTATRLAGNSTTVPFVLTSTGTGSAAAAPAWTTTSGASSVAMRDANQNVNTNNVIESYAATTTATQTTKLTVASAKHQYFTGSTKGQIIQMPVTSTLTNGHEFVIANNSTVTITIKSSGGNLIGAIASGQVTTLTCIDTTVTTAAGWMFSHKNSKIIKTWPVGINDNQNIYLGSGSNTNWYSYATLFTPDETIAISANSVMRFWLTSASTAYYILAVYKYVNGGAQTLMFASTATSTGGTAGYKEAQMSNIIDGNLVAGEYYYMVIFQNANGPNGGGRALGGTNTTKPYRNWTKAVGNLGEDDAGVAPATITEPTGETSNGIVWFLLKS